LKKITSSILSLLLLLIGTVIFASPAQASEIDSKTTLCQATGNGSYRLINVAKKSLVTGNGSNSGINENDIVPPFDFNFGGNDHGTYPGQNWVPGVSETFFANGCNPNANVLTPNLPAATVQATCMDTTGASFLTTPSQPAGVAISEPKLSNGETTWEFTFSKTVADTVYETYSFAKDFSETFIVKILPPLTTDPYWDAKKGACNLPDTGAGGISNTALMFGGGAIGLGLLLFGLLTATGRRRNA
jgi:hypothetical protein